MALGMCSYIFILSALGSLIPRYINTPKLGQGSSDHVEILVSRSGSPTTRFDLSDVPSRMGSVELMTPFVKYSVSQYLADIWTLPRLYGRWLATLRHHFPTQALGQAGTILLASLHEYLGT